MVNVNLPKSYVVLDDLDLTIQNLIRPNPRVGLNDKQVELALEMFKNQEEG